MRQLSADLRKWLIPGMHVKRWLLLLFAGLVLMSIGASYVLREIYFNYTFPDFFYYLSMQFLPRYVRGAIFLAGSVGVVLLAIWQLNRSLLSVIMPDGVRDESLANIIYNSRFGRRGPRVVTLGGGTGMSMLLRGMKEYSANLTAIVTVADDGGSSGVLRRELGIIPPGDVRNCIAALADTEPLMTKLFQYRFSEGSGLEGHSFGNLFIAAMAGVTGGMEEGIKETSRVLAVRGQILPSTLEDVTLWAVGDDGTQIIGESNITKTGGIEEIYIEPENAIAYPGAVQAIREADLIVVGPGSLFTSVLPNLLVKGIRDAVAASPAVKIYVCNVATQHGETDDFGVVEHVDTIESYLFRGAFHNVLANSNVAGPLPQAWHSAPVAPPDQAGTNGNGNGRDPLSRLVLADVVAEENRYRHDPQKLAAAVMRLYYDRGQSDRQAVPEAAVIP